MLPLFGNNKADLVEVHVFNSTSRYLDDLLNIDNPYFEQMVSQIYTNPSDTEAPLIDLVLSITNGIVSTKIHDKLDYINFETVNFSFDGDAPPPSLLWCIHSQLSLFVLQEYM